MIEQVCITILPEREKDQAFIQDELIRALEKKALGSKALASAIKDALDGKALSGLLTNAPGKKAASDLQTGTPEAKNISFVFSKKSIDARHGKVKFVMRYDVYIGEKAPSPEDLLPQWKCVKESKCKSVLVVGSGPAGLFGALKLLEGGVKPIIIERGSDTKSRKVDIAKISTRGLLDSDSNYCFGEGGAGTFSDGKLFTRSNKRGNVGQVLRIFNHFGADPSILTDAHPHIGTDKLPYIINAMRAKIIELGGEFYFNTRCTGFITSGKNSVDGIKTVNTKSGEEKDFFADAVLLATGHSASDIYELLAKTAPKSLEAKTFAAGVRIEHPRATIDAIQFHGRKMPNAAEYSLTSQQTGSSKTGNAASYSKEDERGVYTFCMCPGGFVVPSATESGTIVVNGMSAAKRNSKWSNSAVVVETRPEDIPEKFKEMAKKNGCPALAGLYFRNSIEREAFLQANTKNNGHSISSENSSGKENSMEGQKAPAQLLTDFLSHKKTPQEKLPQTSYFPGITSSRLDQWLPAQMARRMEKAFKEFNKKMKGFICGEALLIAPETRTSTPVRILRDRESYECCALKKLYPAGEGSGYSGGIVSSAMDGINACSKIMERL
ncbi:MAG: FAD-dependent monooxygenase [Treponema sp.]|nr:FAD-dependent monooxygenase [Treponema sp.]